MNLMSEGPNAIGKLQEALISLKQFLLENIQRINNFNQTNIIQSSSVASSPSSDSLKPIFESIQFDPSAATANSGDAISKSLSGSVGISKEFIQNNRKQIVFILSRLLGLTFSAAISYFLFKWLMKNLDPTNADKLSAKTRAEKILKEIGLNKNIDLNEYELCIASNIVLPTSIECSWQDIGGLENIINDLRETVIYPLKNFETELSVNVTNLNKQQIISKRSRLIQPPKGVLLFGPPGNAKTMIAKALAKESGARFINLQVSSLFDKWFGESQKRTEAIFSLALKVQPVIIFIDEIDSFLRSRRMDDHECTSTIKTQFMTLWDGLSTAMQSQNRILIIGATNRPEDVDPAILRRMPQMFYIGLPSELQRKQILSVILKDEQLSSDIDLNEIAEKTEQFSGSDLHELCRGAAMNSFIDHLKQNQSNEATTSIRKVDFDVAFEKMSVKNLANLKNRFNFQPKNIF